MIRLLQILKKEIWSQFSKQMRLILSQYLDLITKAVVFQGTLGSIAVSSTVTVYCLHKSILTCTSINIKRIQIRLNLKQNKIFENVLKTKQLLCKTDKKVFSWFVDNMKIYFSKEITWIFLINFINLLSRQNQVYQTIRLATSKLGNGKKILWVTWVFMDHHH